jgi:predicted acetyltransferase
MIVLKKVNSLDPERVEESKRSNLCFNNNTDYYLLLKDNVEVGFTGFQYYKDKVVFKNHYIYNEYRGKGYFKEMLDISIDMIKKNGYKKIEATCTKMSINEYIKRRAVIIKEYKLFTKVIINL